MRNTRAVQRQRGISLVVVMVMVLLSMLLVMGGSRMAILNESLVGNDRDYQRAFEAAQALLADAELDAIGQDMAGNACVAATCRTPASPVFFPRDLLEYQTLADQLEAAAVGGNPPCINGICLDLGTQTNGDPASSFWRTPAALAPFTATPAGFNSRGATYGQYTRAIGAINSGNPFLTAAPPMAWYWVEILPYSTAAAVGGGNAAFWSPPPTQPFVYRITALAQGRKPGTQAVVQSMVVPDPLRGGP